MSQIDFTVHPPPSKEKSHKTCMVVEHADVDPEHMGVYTVAVPTPVTLFCT